MVGGQLFADFRFSWGLLEINPREKRGVTVQTDRIKLRCHVRFMYDRVLNTLTYTSLDI